MPDRVIADDAQIDESQYEKIVDELIVDVKEKLKNHFEELTDVFSLESNPIGVDEAKGVITALLRIAIVQRNLLSERLAENICDGGLFGKYIKKMSEINFWDAKFKVVNDNVSSVETKYKKKRVLLDRVEKNAYTDDYKEITVEISDHDD